MNIKRYFNGRRLLLLMRNVLLIHSRIILISTAALVLIAFMGHHLLLSFADWSLSFGIFSTGLVIWIICGCIITSLSFRELHHNQKGYFFLTLPGSILEKFSCKLILTSLMYALWLLLIYIIVIEVNGWLIGRPGLPFNPFRGYTWSPVWGYVKSYFVLQAIFFLGAIYFKRQAFFKTLLTVSIIVLFLYWFYKFSIWFFFRDTYMLENFKVLTLVSKDLSNRILILLPPFCWIVTYIRLRESEA